MLGCKRTARNKGGVTEHTLTFDGDYESVMVDGEHISSPYTLTQNITVVVTCPMSIVWDSGGPTGDRYDDYQISVDGQPYDGDTISVTSKDINVEVSRTFPDDTSRNPTRSLVINYTA